MKHYEELSKKYLSAHKKKTRFIILSVIMAVTLVTGIFSMLDSLLIFEKKQVLKSEGNYHILVRDASKEEISYIDSRVDVENAGTLKDIGEGMIDDTKCWLTSLDENFASNLNVDLMEGHYPSNENEIMLEQWMMEDSKWKIGDTVKISLPNALEQEYIISGIYGDWGASKAVAMPIVFIATKASNQLISDSSQHFILFKDGVNVINAEEEIVNNLELSNDRVARNEGLLALMLQTKNNTALKMLGIGVILFCVVLVAAVVMIYNTFHISVMERVSHFGLLRCIGATPVQIRRLVRKEGMYIAVKAIPIGVMAGVFMTFVCSTILKVYNKNLFGDMSYLNFSIIGIGAGVIIGFLTVIMGSYIPARKASKLEPINAVKGMNEMKISKKNKKGFLTRVFHVEIAMGINNALYKKKTLFLMSSSIALSIIMFLGFNVFVNPKYIGMSPIKSYTADVSLTAKEGIRDSVFGGLKEVDGIKEVHGRMIDYVDATFDASKLTELYRTKVNDVEIAENGLILNPEKSGLISYDEKQFEWAKEYLTKGELDEEKLNSENGLIVVLSVYRDNSLTKTTNFQIGDKVYMNTPTGSKEFKVMGIFDTAPNRCNHTTMTTFITTEKLFTQISQDTAYKSVDIQLENKNQEQTINEMKSIIGDKVTVQDKRQLNQESNNAYMTVAVFIYGFIGVIVLISILNIVNTMNTSIVSKTKYLGVMRAVGMTGDQLCKMVLAESFVYSLVGCLTGCLLGSILQKSLLNLLNEDWKLPIMQIIAVFVSTVMISTVAVIGPLKKIKVKDISEVIRSF